MVTNTVFLPQGREFTFITPEALQQNATRAAYAYWKRLCGARPLPRRDEMKMRDITSFLSHMSLVRVLEKGEDFEHRIVGDAMVQAFDVPIQNRRFSEVARDAPKLIGESVELFRNVLRSAQPLAWRHRVLCGEIHIVYTLAEMILLPFGSSPAEIDHIAAFGVHSRTTEPQSDG